MAWTFLMVATLAVIFTASKVHSTPYVYGDLVRDLTAKSRNDVIPKTSLDKPVSMSVMMSLININDVNTKTHEVNVNAWLSMSWDSGLTYDPAEYNNLTNVRLPRSTVWVPDIAMYNGDMVFHDIRFYDYVVVWPSGKMIWIPVVKIHAICNVEDVTLASNTTCNVKVGPWVHNSVDLRLAEGSQIDIDSYLSDESAFKVTDISAKKESKWYSCCEEVYEDILFSFTFHKK